MKRHKASSNRDRTTKGAKSLWNVSQMAEYLGLSKDTIYRKARAGDLPAVRLGRSWRFPQEAVEEWLKREIEKNHAARH